MSWIPLSNCHRCGALATRYREPRAGGWAVTDRCDACKRCAIKGRPYLPKDRSYRPGLPIWDPYGSMERACSVCGNLGPTQHHHFAPTKLFPEDADNWPTAALCHHCHTRWHNTVWPRTRLPAPPWPKR